MSSSISHGIIAFLMPLGWAIIIYPLCRRYHLPWVKTFLLILGVSFLSMLIKELFDAYISVNDIVADIIGLFFGAVSLSALLIWGGKGVSGLAVGTFQMRGQVSLRDFLSVVLTMEERAVLFFEEAFRRLTDERSKDLCLELAGEEKKHVDVLKTSLSQWNYKTPEEEFARALEEKMNEQGLYIKPLLTGALPVDVLEYAVEMNGITQDLYSAFMRYFPMDWKREKINELLSQQVEYGIKLRGRLKELSAAGRY